jgi:hypothetical protein
MTKSICDGPKTKCVFVPNWNCPVETPEIPIEICRLCLEARKLQSKHAQINRKVETVEIFAATPITEIEPERPGIVP